MKKTAILAPLLALPLLLLSACKAPASSITLSANWNKDTTIRAIDLTAPSDLIEELSYEITFESGRKENEYAVHYEEGTYETKLERRFNAEAKEYGYLYSTVYDIKVHFTVNGETSDTFQEHVEESVEFANLDNMLRPVKSVKRGQTYTPLRNSPKSLKEPYYAYYDYTHEITYDNPLSRATINQTIRERFSTQTEERTASEVENKSVSLKANNYFDNEQLLFMLRGFDMSGSETVTTISPNDLNATKIKIDAPKAVSQKVEFSMKEKDAEAVTVSENIDAFSTTIGLTQTMSGMSQTLVYAAKTSPTSNTYRNLLLERKLPFFSTFGTMTYTLKEAIFYL